MTDTSGKAPQMPVHENMRRMAGAWLRYIYLAVFSVYLLALIGSLFEAHSYQQLITRLGATDPVPSQIAPEDWRRMLLLAVREANRVDCSLPAAKPPQAGSSQGNGKSESGTESKTTLPAQVPDNMRDQSLKIITDVLALANPPVPPDTTPVPPATIGDPSHSRAGTSATPQQTALALTMLRAYQDLDRYHFFLIPYLSRGEARCGHGYGFNALDLGAASSTTLDLAVVFTMGALGSLIYIVQYLLRQATQGIPYNKGAGRSWAWMLFRPMFGIALAFALYLLYKAGQIALGSSSSIPMTSDINLPLLGTLSLFAGLMSWQVLSLIQNRGKRFLEQTLSEAQWATGLETVLKDRNLTPQQLALTVGVSEQQVQRWIEFADPVPPEMQNRLVRKLDISHSMLFFDEQPLADAKALFTPNLARIMEQRQTTSEMVAAHLNIPLNLLKEWQTGAKAVPWRHVIELARELDTSAEELIANHEAQPVDAKSEASMDAANSESPADKQQAAKTDADDTA